MSNNWPTIFYFGNDWSADNKTSSHHIANRLMRDHNLIYVECPGLRAPQGTKRDIKKIFSKTFKALRGPRLIGTNSFVYTLFQLPFHKYRFVRYLNGLIIQFSLWLLSKALNAQRPILWFVIPHLSSVLGKLNESLRVYYCIDDYSSLPGVDKSMIQQMDEEMTKKSDIVFVASEPLLSQKQHCGNKVVLSRHGVDFKHFNQAFHSADDLPDEIAHIKSPVVGFFGLIESWVDLNLVKFIAESKPEWNVLMIGRVAVSTNPCEELPNVYFVGSKPYNILPTYAQVFDVAIIPRKKNEFTRNCNPLKLREYLAMGHPVVSMRSPEIEEFSDVVQIADDYEDFLKKIEFLLQNDTSKNAEQRIARVRGLSWENRFEAIAKIVDDALTKTVNT